MNNYPSRGSIKAMLDGLSGWLLCFSSAIRRSIYIIGAGIILISFSAMFSAIFANVLLRYIFDQGITWAYELPQLLFPWSVAAGMVLASTMKGNISIDSLVNILPATIQRIVLIAVNLVIGATCVGVLHYAMPVIKASKYTKLAETGLPQIYGYSSLVFAFSLIAVISLLNIIDYLLSKQTVDRNPENNNYS
ncbi:MULTISPECIES: TRAP transporter small permease [unclassified Neptuniibacter]|uniref:TRAP transporter small permease n=1 Tax=unclassified Neptuniibacter TaxID=2630693 RepID=UPI0025FBCAF2|nr:MULTISPECIES: TRAP transporter small permease [unclassified Neptuniibacter]|tara:strand:+ start:1570 stop:2145 length:576 start_codon:yes stop_codon:yes gene_type:complete